MKLIHARNVRGQGALEVASALIEGAAARHFQPEDLFWVSEALYHKSRGFFEGRRVTVTASNDASMLLARAWELTASFTTPAGADRIYVLGDIPLRSRLPQTVLFHAPNLLPASANPATRTDFSARIARGILRRNAPFATRWVVQSEVFKGMLERGYPAVAGRVAVATQPAPAACRPFIAMRATVERYPKKKTLTLMYPAAGYPHKNHAVIVRFAAKFQSQWASELRVQFTLPAQQWESLRPPASIVENLGRTSLEECYRRLVAADALVFPSLTESFGLPLVEAMTLGLPVLCADLPYARWACGAEAIYFSPPSEDDLHRAVGELRTRLASGWQPDWSGALQKFPPDWSCVADAFFGG